MPFFCIHCRSEIDPKYKACPFCGEAVTEFLRRYLETPVDGKYQILSRLGVGGMGEVYKVLHIHLNAIRVIKLMRSNIANDPEANERFLREARLATKIHHPNVAALFDFSTLDDGSRYMVWEYIEGINLHELLDERGPLSPRYAARIAVEVLHGLEAIHRAGIVHRDISPENLMIARDEDGEERVKIIDLGIAKQWDSGDEKTKTGMFVGKWKYCSPEHLGMLERGERIDGRADLYSFGIVLYEMLTGVPPFQADTPHGFLMLHASERPRALREVNPNVTSSPELEALIFKALEKERTKRFPTARAFAQAIEAILPNLSDAPGAPAPLPKTAELTDGATRVAPRVAMDAPTVVSLAQDAPTVVTKVDKPLGVAKRLEPEPRVDRTASEGGRRSEAKRRGRSGWVIVVVVLLLVVAGIAGYMATRHDEQPVGPKHEEARAIVPPAAGHVAINAFPWAEITKIRNVENDAVVELAPRTTTPYPVDLAPGRYEITLANPQTKKTVTKTIDVQSGAEAPLFVRFDESAPLPDFGAGR